MGFDELAAVIRMMRDEGYHTSEAQFMSCVYEVCGKHTVRAIWDALASDQTQSGERG